MRTPIYRSVGIETLLLVLLTSAPLMAQEFRGSITGSVTDPQGAWIPKTSVVARNLETNVKFETVTDESGLYFVPALPVGFYSVTISAAGFRTTVREKVELRVGDQLRIDFKMELGAVADSITVTGEADLLAATSASQGQVIDKTNVSDMPIYGRNPLALVLLSAGVQVSNTAGEMMHPYDNGGMDNLNVNGGRGMMSEYLLDGSPNTNTERGRAGSLAFVPSPDAIAEFKILTSAFDAQYGRTAGGLITSTLKGGTNNLHGVVDFFARYPKLNANSFVNNLAGTPKSNSHDNEPGLEIDGPVYLPKIYDGRNRTFFMYSWQGIYTSSQGGTALFTVPTLPERQGDFSGLRTSAGGLITIYDPLTTQGSGGTYTRQPFPGNRIPLGRVDPVALNIMAYYPNPNFAPSANGQNDYASHCCYPSRDNYNAHVMKVDEILSARHRLSVRYVRNNRQDYTSNFGYPDPVQGGFVFRINTGGNVDVVSMLSPTRVLISRIGVTQHQFAQGGQYGGGTYHWDPTPLGFPSQLIAQLPEKFFPGISATNYSDLATGGGSPGNRYDFSTNWSWLETLNVMVRAHSLKFGTEFRSLLDNPQLPTSSFGTFTFTKNWTQSNPLTADAASGDGFATFFLGLPTSAGVPINVLPAYENRYYAVFFQDDWRVAKKLTLNLGLRWDYESPITERYNRINVGFDPNAASPFQVPGMNLKGGLLFAGASNRLAYKRDLNNVQPRIGVAYQFLQRTVFRGGYGITYYPTFDPPTTNGFSTSTAFVASVDGGITPSGRLSNPYPQGLVLPPGSSQGLATLVGQAISYAYPGRTVPYMHQFSVGFQQQLPWLVLVDASYEGSRTHDLGASKNINAVSAQDLSLGAGLAALVPNPFQGLLPGTAYNNATVTRQQLLLPFPQFGSITRSNYSVGTGWFNAFELRVEKRLTAGLHFLLSYTLSKTMEAAGYLNPQNSDTQLERVLTSFDGTHRLVLSIAYELPSPRSSNNIVRAILRGWQVNMLGTFQSGLPIAGPAGGFPTGVNPAVVEGARSRDNMFNTCTLTLTGVRQNCASPSQAVAWTTQPPYTLNTMSSFFPNVRTRRPPLIDTSLFKTFRLREGLQLHLRGEAFDVTNDTWFNAPNTTVGSSLFGYTGPSVAAGPRNVQLALKLLF